MFYNEERKKKYIEEKKAQTIISPYYLDNLFEKSFNQENDLNKDLCDFTGKEILEMYKLFNMSSYSSMMVMNSSYSLYTDWCIDNGLIKDGFNHYSEMDTETISSCLNKRKLDKQFVTRPEIIAWCDTLPNPSDSFTLLALFEGLDYEEIINTKCCDFVNGTLTTFKGRTIEVSDKLKEYAEYSMEMDVYYSITMTMEKTVNLSDNGFVIKDYINAKPITTISSTRMKRRIFARLIRIFDYLGIGEYMNPQGIINSGIICMIKSKAKQIGITNHEYVTKYLRSSAAKQYGKRIASSKAYWENNKKYLS